VDPLFKYGVVQRRKSRLNPIFDSLVESGELWQQGVLAPQQALVRQAVEKKLPPEVTGLLVDFWKDDLTNVVQIPLVLPWNDIMMYGLHQTSASLSPELKAALGELRFFLEHEPRNAHFFDSFFQLELLTEVLAVGIAVAWLRAGLANAVAAIPVSEDLPANVRVTRSEKSRAHILHLAFVVFLYWSLPSYLQNEGFRRSVLNFYHNLESYCEFHLGYELSFNFLKLESYMMGIHEEHENRRKGPCDGWGRHFLRTWYVDTHCQCKQVPDSDVSEWWTPHSDVFTDSSGSGMYSDLSGAESD
jgi:hypothetical protein